MHITAQGPRLRNDLYCVEWDVKLYYTIPYRTAALLAIVIQWRHRNVCRRKILSTDNQINWCHFLK